MDYQDNIFIPIIRPYNPQKKYEITGSNGTDDVTANAIELTCNKPLLNYYGVGKFKLIILNNNEYYTDRYKTDDLVRIYIDHVDASTQQFYGYIESAVGVYDEAFGNTLEISGIHYAKAAVEKSITSSITNVETSAVITGNIIPNKLTTFTSTNVNTSTANFNKDWSYKNIANGITELCKKAGFDCYIDDDLDIHYFESGSINQSTDAVVFGKYGNIIEIPKFGSDTINKIETTTVIGEDDSGMLIVSTSGTGTKEKIIKASNVVTVTDAEEYASSYIDNTEEIGSIKTFGIANVNPGDMLYVEIPFMNISKRVKVINIEHIIGDDMIWYTKTEFVKKVQIFQDFLKDRIESESEAERIYNPNGMKDSYLFSFNDSTNIDSSSSITIADGMAKIESGFSNGTIITAEKEFTYTFTALEFRKIGSNLGASKFYYRITGEVWIEITSFNSIISATGTKLSMKIVLNDTTEYKSPELDSFSGYVK